MISFKPEMDTETAQTIIENILNDTISHIAPIDIGELSKVFSYIYQEKEYVVHFNSSNDRFMKERFLYEHFRPQGLPIPQLYGDGKVGDLFYSISEKAEGHVIVSLPEEQIKEILPNLVKNFTIINHAEVNQSNEYGWIQSNGEGSYSSWEALLDSFFNKQQTGFWENWYDLFEDSFLEKEVFDDLYSTMMELLQYAPEQKYLVHGDFHLGNMIACQSEVTGIVDWEMALYGDFMIDLATMHFWNPQLNFPQLVKEKWAKEKIEIPNFEERLIYGMIFKGIDGLRFFAKKNDKSAYDYIKEKLFGFIKS